MPGVALRLLLAALLLLAGIRGAAAHASLLGSDPADASVLARAPGTMTLTFNEPVAPLAFRLVDAAGIGVALTDVTATNETVRVSLPAMPGGSHALSWRVISADGHPVGGAIVFAVRVASASGIGLRTGGPPLLAGMIWSARLTLYVGLLFGVGGVVFGAWIARAGASFARACLLAGLVACAVSVGLQGADALGEDAAALGSVAAWAAGAAGAYARTLALSCAALTLGLIAGVAGPSGLARFLSLAALACVGSALATSGHASDTPPRWLARAAVFLHGTCVAFWLGSLVPLAHALRDERGTVALRRFSAAIPLPLFGLLAAGTTLAVLEVQRPGALLTTSFGQVLATKLGLATALLALAAWNRWRLAGQVLLRAIAVETVLAMAILGVVSLWRFTPPPRALAAATLAARPAHVHIHGPQAMIDISVTPGRPGPVTVSLAVLNGDFGPLSPREVALTLSNPDLGVEAIRRPARHVDGPTWRIEGLTVPAPGIWTARVELLIDEFTELTLEDALVIRPSG